jgi:hypothetical protein
VRRAEHKSRVTAQRAISVAPIELAPDKRLVPIAFSASIKQAPAAIAASFDYSTAPNRVVTKTALKSAGGDRISRSSGGRLVRRLKDMRRKTMKTATKLIVAAALLLSTAPAALAQSAYTTGSAASNARAGYAIPGGRDFYGSAPTFDRPGLSAYGSVGGAPFADRPDSPGETGGGSTGYNAMEQQH